MDYHEFEGILGYIINETLTLSQNKIKDQARLESRLSGQEYGLDVQFPALACWSPTVTSVPQHPTHTGV